MLLKMDELRELIKLVDQSSLTEFKIKSDGFKVSMKKETAEIKVTQQEIRESVPSIVSPAGNNTIQTINNESNAVEEEKASTTPELHKITSPMVGTFYAAPAPDAAPYVQKGDKVTESTIVCIVEAMKLMNEIEAEVKGTIVEVLVENGQLVEYRQPLFLVKAE